MSLVDETLAAPGELLGDLGRVRDDDHAIVPDGQRHRQVFLDGDIRVELPIVSKICDAEGALPQHGLDDVTPNARSGCECHIVVPMPDNEGVAHCYLARDEVTTASLIASPGGNSGSMASRSCRNQKNLRPGLARREGETAGIGAEIDHTAT